MVKPNRTPRSKDDLQQELRDQLQLLRMSCEHYDRGVEAAGKHIALSLRVLLHVHRQSRALLEQLGYRDRRFYSTGRPLRPNNLLAEAPLLMMTANEAGVRWDPIVFAGGGPVEPYLLPFSEWWLQPILKDNLNNIFTRLSLVQHVADTDGGAHVDPDLDEAYMALSRKNSIGWVIKETDLAVEGQPHLACMRQIAHEVLYTLSKSVPELSEAARPVLPKE